MAPGTLTMESAENQQSNTIVFNTSKAELFNPNNGFKSLARKLRSNWKIIVNKDELTQDKIQTAKVLVFGGPRKKFTAMEFDAIKQYIEGGGNVLVMMGEGGEARFDTNINFLLEDYGIMVNNDSVVRTVYYKYFHPKEALVSNGVLNREINRAAGKYVPGTSDVESSEFGKSLTFVLPYGATLNVVKPATAVLSTGSVSFPLNRPVCAFHSSKYSKGKLAVLGSVHMFSDQYIDKEENAKVQDVIFQWLTTNELHLNNIDAEDPEVADYHHIPDTSNLAERLRVCLQEGDEIPRDFTKMFDSELYKLDTGVVSDVIKAFDELHVKHEPLQLITPQFETPLPPLQPAVFPPTFRELPPPALDLFDLDEAFSSEKVRLAQITNKCSEDDLEYYVRECGDILNVNSKLPGDNRTAKHILDHIFHQVVEFKKLNQETDDTSGLTN
ncbi:intraflagellar transport protein 52 homolog [Exaiptasia diaphana]|uniref:Uncharacterized protein n=1 Tax=Exaiptasia diaphana TaxID=2652724 RepID=A0A913WYI0_EXADI|nr:intraflagellar transport protein 52 homolog [Exaiptasia diaphana]KXJ27589.1 Intraflagellar transport protein 52-like [Exaiptasia diaphana]